MRVQALALLLALIASLQLPAIAEDRERLCSRKEDRFGVERLSARVAREHLYADHARGPRACVSYMSHPCDSQWVYVSVHERHNQVCGGDPATAPALDHFRVNKKTQAIEWMEITSGDYLPFEGLCTRRQCSGSTGPEPRK